ncbi:mannitol dehydrogenase family protein [Pseudolysinimonas sp.]|uniref:mannitol dehydrogenase family protein n=1 Tax=Pseudolysinimonas sp. TaxID=2680009 RepID=UPI003F7F863D
MTALRREGAAPPVRIAHLGLGAFHRSHQVALTARAADAERWGFASFGGRGSATADALAAQDGLFTLVERGPERDELQVLSNLVRTGSAADDALLREIVARASTAMVTLTVTEAGYRLDRAGALDLADDAVRRDVDALRDRRRPTTPLGRLVDAVRAGRDAGGGPIAVVPCDNLADAGRLVAGALQTLADRVDPALAAWIAVEAPVASCSVDRITPATTDDDRRLVRELTGVDDASPVVAEPFASWVIEGSFPAGRPDWGDAVDLVDDVGPYERRKLWMLNGAHTYLALAGGLRGCSTVAEAIADRTLRRRVEELWDACARQLDLPGLGEYRAQLLARFENARIRHELAQIRLDTELKLRMRVPPVLLAERAAGRPGTAHARVLAAWLRQPDVRERSEPIATALARIDPRLTDPAIVDLTRALLEEET